MKLAQLNAADIPLVGKHLIEASAGTGKTYNITRIYLRLLLERELKVEQILLMTFTKDATQELRGRIDVFIREALVNWSTLSQEEPYFKAISERVSADKVEFLLKRALLFLDEAAIFTIHGFCQRALAEHAFASGLPFNAALSTSSSEIVLEACQDWYRQLAKQSSDDFSLIAQFWPAPTSFIQSFSKAIYQEHQLSIIDSSKIVTEFSDLARQGLENLTAHASVIEAGLVSHKTAAEQDKRSQALIALQNWLEQISACDNEAALLAAANIAMPDYLLNGNRHPKAFKVQLADILAPCKTIKTALKNLAKNINKAKAYKLVRSAIYSIRAQVSDKKQQLNLLDFDDLISTLALSLSKEQGDNSLAKTLLAQYPVALVDEFQDTDPQQFSILQGLYYSEQASLNDGALYLIGDPKQAIYGFRGGDIFAYLAARHSCDHHWLMDTNYRSSADMITAYNQVFVSNAEQADDAVFGYGIDYKPVNAGKVMAEQDSLATDKGKALQFVHFSHQTDEKVTLGQACPLMAIWCANEITQLLTSKQVKPQDIAILVRDNREAQFIKQALQEASLASVFLSDRANLFHSEQAQQLLRLLKGILAPENERVYLASLTCGLLGYDAVSLHQLQQDELAYQKVKFAFIDFKKQWQQQGFIAMAINVMHQHFVIPSINKDRILTNILHLFEILQAASQRFLQSEELLYWFEQQCSLETINSELEAELRLESDGNLIRIITQHGAKGLEYPVVFIPFASKHKDPLKFGNQNISYLEYHDEQGQLQLSLDGDDQAKAAMASEAYAESIRLLYVAITRAEKRCYLLTAPFDKCHLSPLGKALQWQAEGDIKQNLTDFIDSIPHAASVEQVYFDEVCLQSSATLTSEDVITDTLTVSKFAGKIERDWWLSSFSALSRNLRHGGVSTPDRDAGSEPSTGSNNNAIAVADKQQLRFALAKGAHSGNLLHDILEHTDFQLMNLAEASKWPLVKYGELTTPFTLDDLITWLEEVLHTPLVSSNTEQTNQASAFCLADVSLSQSMRESEFYFPMQQASMQELAKLLTDHRNTAENKSTALTNSVKLPSYQSLKGMMHGFIDLVFEQAGRYYVCDYKSSHLGDKFSDYHSAALQMNVENNYYDLQYLIYSLALHRYLKLNVENYNVSEHFGGIYYLYLRGMTPDVQHSGAGVYYREITEHELEQLDSLFLGEKIMTEQEH